MERLPTIILPDGQTLDDTPSSGRSSTTTPRQRMSLLSKNGGVSPSSSSSLLLLPETSLSAAGSAGGDAPPTLVRFASVRLRAKKTPKLAEDFYVRRMGMALLQPALPPCLSGLEGGALNRSRSVGFEDAAVRLASRRASRGGCEKAGAGEEKKDASADGGVEERGTPWLTPQDSFHGSSSGLSRSGSMRLEEEEKRHWLLRKKRCACAVGYNYDRDVLPVRLPGECEEQRKEGTDDRHLVCAFKSLRHELLLELTPPDASIPDSEVVPYEHHPSDAFSRLAFSVADVNAAQVALSSQMIRVGNAAQFADVNFAVTFRDPENFRGRILQHLSEYTFARKDGAARTFHRRTLSNLGLEETPPLGSRGLLHHVELRVRDIEASLKFYQEVLRLRLISKQSVSSFGVTFFFLTTDPNALPPTQYELDSHGNRAWLWEQRFSSICLKTFTDAATDLDPYQDLSPRECGFLGLTFLCKKAREAELCSALEAVGAPLKKTEDPIYALPVYETRDPDNIPLRVVICDDAAWTA
ncbi:hypothetical protein BESB_051540 [Besnoitia besnoiti]|uniref:VOC domain-containing protein n=1 Tax=Besnoitia besnoiti TaxID=94643 RepID=A0A2A9MIN3_BESBE|nr:hypothetical protein BESB_051540 [Besnoitia besnoiti]PFH35503.1 hypothetical protein BESB_051540 [Besnoitia besnoiti]